MNKETGWMGTPPKDGNLIAENNEWMLYLLSGRTADGFINAKLVSKQRRADRANYWLGFRRANVALCMGHDAKQIEQLYPELYRWVTQVLTSLCKKV